MRKTIKHYVLSLFAICIFGISNLNAQTFTSTSALIDAVKAAGTTGGTFILANGSYSNFDGGFTDVKATAAKPIIIKAQSVGGVTLTGASKFSFKRCSYITVQGFNIIATNDETLFKLEGCNNMRVSRNVLDLTTTEPVKWVYIGGLWDDTVFPYANPSHHNRIDHNIFQNKTTPGHYITIDGNNEADQSQYDRIDHNYFKDNVGRAVNEKESIRVGWSKMSKSSGFTTVEYNLFERCDGDPEIVSIKSSDNVVRHNTFRDNFGTLSFRHGNRNRSEGNYFYGGRAVTNVIVVDPYDNEQIPTNLYTGGMRMYGTDHVIVNNYFEGLNGTKWDAPLTITQGDAKEETSTDLTKHFIPKNIVIAYNTLVNNDNGIEIGFDNNDNYKQKVDNVLVANNIITSDKNSLVKIVENDQGSSIRWANNLFYPTGAATIVAGGTTTTSFVDAQAKNENPFLVSTNGVSRSTSNTPLYANGSGISNTIDIEGQARPASSNPGADHLSTASVRYQPMTTTTVGPNAYGDEATDNELPDFKTLAVSTLSDFTSATGIGSIAVTSNQSWAASITTAGASWLTTTSATSGSGVGTLGIAVAANTGANSRSAVITFTAGTLTATTTITQAGVPPSNGFTLINDKSVNDKVTVYSVFNEEITSSKNNIAINSLDKNTGSNWSGNNGAVPVAGTNVGEIIYNLGGSYDLQLVDYMAAKSKTYNFQILVSSTTADASAFSNPFGTGNLTVSTVGTEFKSFTLPTVATGTKYVKIVGYGQATSLWNTIVEIEFYGTVSNPLSTKENNVDSIAIYPVPAKHTLNVDLGNVEFTTALIYSVDGKLVKTVNINSSNSTSLDVSSLAKGMYVLKILNKGEVVGSKRFIVSN